MGLRILYSEESCSPSEEGRFCFFGGGCKIDAIATATPKLWAAIGDKAYSEIVETQSPKHVSGLFPVIGPLR